MTTETAEEHIAPPHGGEKLGNVTADESGEDIEHEAEEVFLAKPKPDEVREKTEAFRQSPKTVRELLDAWAEEYKTTDDDDRKRELAFRMMKMNLALSASHLAPERVKVASLDEGTLGFYVPDTKEIYLTPEGVELDPQYYRDVLEHESAHAGKMTGHRLMDESMAEQFTVHYVPHPLRGIYESEVRKADTAFKHVGIYDALRLYDFDRPHELVAEYLDVEWKNRWNRGLKYTAKKKDLLDAAEREKFMHGVLRKDGERIERVFKAAVPDMYDRLKQKHFDFKKVQQIILERLLEKD